MKYPYILSMQVDGKSKRFTQHNTITYNESGVTLYEYS